MGRIWMLGGGGGADLDVITAEAKDVLAGKVIVDKDGNPLSGTMQTMSGGTYTPSTSQQRISCAEKKMTGDIIIPAFTLPSANVIKKGVTVDFYGKKVTGTFQGYVDDKLWIYNHGTWSNMTTPGFTGYKANVAPVDSGGTITFTQNDTRRIGVTKSSINFSGYKYLKMNVYGQKNHYGVTSVGAKFLDNPSDDAGKQPGGVSELPDKTWTLVTIPLANVQKWAYLWVSFSTIRGSTSAETTVDSKINEIYLSKY